MRFSGLVMAALLLPPLYAQSSEVSIRTPPSVPVIGRFLAPFHLEKRVVAPPRLENSPRLESLVRGGNLYLSVQDVIALVLENNLDIAVQRYTPLLAREVLRRAEGGNILRSIETPILPGPTSVSTAGISTNANGLAGAAAFGTGGGIVTQVGPSPPNLDPYIAAQAQIGPLHHAGNQPAAQPDHRADQQLPLARRAVRAAMGHRDVRPVHVLQFPQLSQQLQPRSSIRRSPAISIST